MEEQSNLSPEQSPKEQFPKCPDNCAPHSFIGLPIDNLIGGPLRAAAEAQQKMVNSTNEFLKNGGQQELVNSTKEFLEKIASEEKKGQ
ncbi:DUF2589 domain-containing protein [Bacteroides neonati]|uniref:DUF2589 domain-containing protein n=1 Tax=Bacteroides neonati TaxID=1347393 RepID=UPI0004B9065A|nr:DUF2589 domain-containing protein [Bacteroides neonati]